MGNAIGYFGMGAIGVGTNVAAGIINGQNGTGLGSEDEGKFLGSLAGHVAVGGAIGAGAKGISHALGKKPGFVGVAATIATSSFLGSRF